MNKNRFGWTFAILDFISTGLAWFIFYVYRKRYLEPAVFGEIELEFTERFFLGVLLIPLFWVFVYHLNGSYKRVYRRSRLNDLVNTFVISFTGTILIFFVLILDDFVKDPSFFRNAYLVLFISTFSLRFIIRFLLLTLIKTRIVRRKIGFNTLLVGDNESALTLYNELENEKYSQGYQFKGFIKVEGHTESFLQNDLVCLGTENNMLDAIYKEKIEDVIIALEPGKHDKIGKLLDVLDGENVVVKMIPDMYDIVSGRVKMKNVFGTALIEIYPEILPSIQANIKRILDVVISSLALLVLSPLYLFLAFWVKSTSKGPIFYLQERVGLKGSPFFIIKYRTMVVNAEKERPQLSRTNDPRITSSGRIMRKFRFDELPQFYNVLKGEMSLVGPRPERQFFIDQITEKAPQYKHLLKVKPGITSWGMVKYGYAQNVEQMIERMKYDLLYIENMSLAMDLKIFLYTAITILGGRGK